MADRIIQSDSGNDVVIQNDDASSKVEVNDDGTVEITGDASISGDLKVSGNDIKSSTGETALSLNADDLVQPSAGKFQLGSSGGIYESDGSTPIIVESGGKVSFPAGHMIQLVQTAITGTTSAAVTSYTDISGFTASITPVSTSNKILVQVSANIGGNIDEGIAIQLVRGSTPIYIGDASGSRTRASINLRTLSVWDAHPVSFMYLDSPSSTSATTYKLQWQNLEDANHMYLNQSGNSADTDDRAVTASSITLMEIQG
jgi:hypothetical protein